MTDTSFESGVRQTRSLNQIHRVGDAEAMGAVSSGVVREVEAGVEEPVLCQGVVESRRSSTARAGRVINGKPELRGQAAAVADEPLTLV